jgi:hypothetical protein
VDSEIDVRTDLSGVGPTPALWSDLDLDAQFFSQFPGECLLLGLPYLDLAAGELPVVWEVDRAAQAPGEEDALGPSQDRTDNE